MAHSSYIANTERYRRVGGGQEGLSIPALFSDNPTDTTHTFQWNPGNANDYRIELGLVMGSGGLFSGPWLGNVSETTVVNEVPAQPFWLRLYYRLGDGEPQYVDRQYFPQISNLWDDSREWQDNLLWQD